MIKTTRLQLTESSYRHPTPMGAMRCVCANAVAKDEPFPTLIVASVLLVEMKGKWLLSHLLVDDEARRHGFATEVVSFYEERLGGLAACWASDAGAAFARKYVERFGPRPHWQIGPDPRLDALFDELGVRRKK